MRLLPRLFVLVPFLPLIPAWAAESAEEAKIRAGLLSAQYVEGKVAGVKTEGDQKLVTVEYLYQKKTRVDPVAARKVEFLKGLYDKAVASKQQEFINKVGAELEKAQKEAGGVEEVPIKFTLRIDADSKLRTLVVPLDDNGKPKKLSTEEQKKLKGDPRLPGYVATLENFEEGTPVRFFVDKVKYKPVTKNPKDKDAELPLQLYPVSMVVIQQPPPVDMTVNPFTKGSK